MNKYEQVLFKRLGSYFQVRQKSLPKLSYASADLLTRKIEISDGFMDAPAPAVEATLLHEVGHLRDGLLHSLTTIMLLSVLIMGVGIFGGFTWATLLGVVGVSVTTWVRAHWYTTFEDRADAWAARHFSLGAGHFQEWKHWSRAHII